jgi:hypothetical protein
MSVIDPYSSTPAVHFSAVLTPEGAVTCHQGVADSWI